MCACINDPSGACFIVKDGKVTMTAGAPGMSLDAMTISSLFYAMKEGN